ncbi:hypothetical protein [Fibrella aquatilis]|uniref:Uncharacterized protein n=1 Tax=Fibrella aquatilis TaxID=2817059 RepID=A0A939G1X8_9BACT|nr:hypothetical protein [Fibrella aquatilis]MBO0930529.1 hypothetical protein [Fibrella aquatilis]
MVDMLKAVFPQIEANTYLQTLTDLVFCIYDQDTEPKRCFIQHDPEGIVHFTVHNSTGRAIHFLAIDRGVISGSVDMERCDCAVFDHKTFCFIEIKVVADTQVGVSNRKAKSQLRTTILYFREQLDFTTRRIEAYICVGATTPRPARLAKDLNERYQFEEETGAALYHGNEKRFA